MYQIIIMYLIIIYLTYQKVWPIINKIYYVYSYKKLYTDTVNYLYTILTIIEATLNKFRNLTRH